MSSSFPFEKKTSKTRAYIHLLPKQASTFHSDHITIDLSAGVDTVALDAFNRPSNTTMLEKTIEEFDELEWDNIVSQPRVQRGLSRLAADIRRQIAAGEIEEGGFAVE